MIKESESINDLKRKIYLWIMPFILLAILLNTILHSFYIDNLVDLILNSTLIFWFSISWFFAYKNRFIRFAEYSNLALISLYHILTFFLVTSSMVEAEGSLGDFIIWTPLYIMFMFLTLGTRRGFAYSIGIFIITLGIGVYNIPSLSSESIDSITQFHFANIVYIVVLYFAQHLFRTYAENAVLKEHAYIDSLTGVANRHQIDEWLESKIENEITKKERFSVIFFDIDHFKQINDRFGHKTGDLVLKEFAKLIDRNIMDNDLFGRWGGEEFIVITDATNDEAYKLAAKLKNKVFEHEFHEVGKLTASFGVTVSQVNDTIDSVLNRADQGLYKSKEAGRNQINLV